MAATGIRQRHGRRCTRASRCDCPWQAEVYSKKDGKKIRRAFPTRAAAVAWRDDSRSAVRQSRMQAPTGETLRGAAKAWLTGAREGVIRTRSGDSYKPSAIRSYERALRLRVLPAVGDRRLTELTRIELQDLADRLATEGLNPSTIGVTLLPLRAIYRRALSRGEVTVNPTAALELPKVRGGRDRIADPDECARLLRALSVTDRPIWATAMYAGLRRGELFALRIEDVDLARGLIYVRRGWDRVHGEIPTKSRGERKVPIAAVLRDYLDEHILGLKWGKGLVFGVSAVSPFADSSLSFRADKAWQKAKLARITLHECRHTFASLMIAAGVNAKSLSTYMGHAGIAITLDRYGHLMPGNEDEAAGMLDAYLARADTKARLAQLAPATGTNPGTSRTDLAL
jgi:integrase